MDKDVWHDFLTNEMILSPAYWLSHCTSGLSKALEQSSEFGTSMLTIPCVQ